MNFKIGDIVKINKKTAYHVANASVYKWYSNKIYTIINIKDQIAELNENLANMDSNKIHIIYLKLLREERKEKLLKLNKL